MTNQEKQKLLEGIRRDLIKLTHNESNPHVLDLACVVLEVLSKLLFLIGRANGKKMLIEEALNCAKNYRDYLDTLISEARDGKRAKELERENRTLTRKIECLEQELKLYKKKNNCLTWILGHVNGVLICNTCDGIGAFETDEGYEPCPDCNELGYLKKELGKD